MLGLDLLSQVVDCLELVDAVQQVANVLDHFLLLFCEGDLGFERLEGCIDPRVVGDGALEVVGVDVEEGLGVLGQADGGHRLGPRGNPVVLQDLLLALDRVRQHPDDVDAGAAEREEIGILSQVDDGLDQVLLLNEGNTVLV